VAHLDGGRSSLPNQFHNNPLNPQSSPDESKQYLPPVIGKYSQGTQTALGISHQKNSCHFIAHPTSTGNRKHPPHHMMLDRPANPDFFHLQLRDQTPILARPILPSDRAFVAEAYRILSPDARYQRFWTRTGEVIGDSMLDRILQQNPSDHMTWAIIDHEAAFLGLGGASWWKIPDSPTTAEMSIMVLDAHQQRGVGTLLLAIMWLTAFRANIETLVAYTLLDNRRAASWLKHCGGIGSWDGYKLSFSWDLQNPSQLPPTPAAADLAQWLAELGPTILGLQPSPSQAPHNPTE
jgi:hypothetical protein